VIIEGFRYVKELVQAQGPMQDTIVLRRNPNKHIHMVKERTAEGTTMKLLHRLAGCLISFDM